MIKLITVALFLSFTSVYANATEVTFSGEQAQKAFEHLMSIRDNARTFVNTSSDDMETVLTSPNLQCTIRINSIGENGIATYDYSCVFIMDDTGKLSSPRW